MEVPISVRRETEAKKATLTDRKRKKKKIQREFSIYIFRLLKELHYDRSISVRAMAIMNSLMYDIFHRIASEASCLVKYNNRATITSDAIQTAVRLILPGELGKHAISSGTKALMKYDTSK